MKIPGAKGNPEQLNEIKQTFSLIPGIEQVDVNPDTGSIVLRYDPDRHDDFHAGFHHHCDHHHGGAHQRPPTNEIDALANKIEQEAEFLARAFRIRPRRGGFLQARRPRDQGRHRQHARPEDGAGVGVVGFTVFEVGATAATPVWVTLSLFGLNHFIEMQTEHMEAESRMRGAPADGLTARP